MTWRQYGGSFDNPINPEYEQEARLVEQARAGSERAFSALLARYQQPVFRMILYLVGDVEEARDLARLAIRNALLHMPNVPAGHSIRPWLLRVAVLVALDAVRARGGTPQELIASLQLPSPERPMSRVVDADPAESDTMELGITRMEHLARAPETVIADAWDALPLDVERELIRRLLGSLPEGDAELLALGVVGQIPTRDLAALAGTSQRSIRRRIARALILFQSRYQQVRTDALPPAAEAKELPSIEPNTSPLDVARRGLSEATARVRRGLQGVHESLGEIEAQERLQTLRAIEDDVPAVAVAGFAEHPTQIIDADAPTNVTASPMPDPIGDAGNAIHFAPPADPASWTAPVPSMDVPDLSTASIPVVPRDQPLTQITPPTPVAPRVTSPIVIPPDPAPRQPPVTPQRILPRFGPPPEDIAPAVPPPVAAAPPPEDPPPVAEDVTTQPLLSLAGSSPQETLILPGPIVDPILSAAPVFDAPAIPEASPPEDLLPPEDLVAEEPASLAASAPPVAEVVTELLPFVVAPRAASESLTPPAEAVETPEEPPIIAMDALNAPEAEAGAGTADPAPMEANAFPPEEETSVAPAIIPLAEEDSPGKAEAPVMAVADPPPIAAIPLESAAPPPEGFERLPEEDDAPEAEDEVRASLLFALERAPATSPRHMAPIPEPPAAESVAEATTEPALAAVEPEDPVMRAMERAMPDAAIRHEKAASAASAMTSPEENIASAASDGMPPEEDIASAASDGMPPEEEPASAASDGMPPEEDIASAASDGMPPEEEPVNAASDGMPPEEEPASVASAMTPPEEDIASVASAMTPPEEDIASAASDGMPPEEEPAQKAAKDTRPETTETAFTSVPAAMERDHHATSPPTIVGRPRAASPNTVVVGNDARADYLSRHKPSWMDAADLGTMPGVAIDPDSEDAPPTPPDAPAPPPAGTFAVPPSEPLDAPRDFSPNATIDQGDLGDITSFGISDSSAEE